MDEFPGVHVAKTENGPITAYAIQNDSEKSHDIDVLSQEDTYVVEPEEIIIALNFSSRTGLELLAPMSEIDSLIYEEHFFVIDGNKHSVPCRNCSDFTRNQIFVHEDNDVQFSAHPRCLKNIREAVEELLESVQIVAHTI